MTQKDMIPHEQGPCPVSPTTTVVALLGDGTLLSPIHASELDWDCPDDPVIGYRIHDEDA